MTDEQYMNLALLEARKAIEENEVPVGAIVVFDGNIVGKGHNGREAKLDISSHAEIEAIKDAEKNLGKWDLSGCTLYVTVEPCLMCSGAILQSNISRLVFGTTDPTMGAVCSHYEVFDDVTSPNRPLVTKGVLEKECANLMLEFFKSVRKTK